MTKINQKSSVLLRGRSLLVLVMQAGLVGGSLFCACLLRFEFGIPDPGLLWVLALLLITIRLVLMPFFNLMHGWWRYTGISDAITILKFIGTGSLAFLVIVRYGWGLKTFPLSIYALEALITFTLLTGVRVLSRMLAQSVRHDSGAKRHSWWARDTPPK